MSEPSRPWVLITGCSSGIGKALVGVCRAAGWGVVATARHWPDLADLPDGEDLRRLGLDVTSPDSLADAVAGCSGLRLVALINNAGYGQMGPLEFVRPEELRAQFETNVVGLQAVTNAFLPLIRKNAARGEGRIVQVASMLGRLSIPLAGPYNASKHAVVALAETLRLEIGREIPVVLVEPGAVASSFRDTIAKTWGDLPDRVQGTPYARILANFIRTRKRQAERYAGSPEQAARRILKALTRKHPPRRILIRPEARLAGWAKAILPAAVWEWFLRRSYGLN
ncbi:MAG: SDR family oxidoreductase [Holophagaceae bacterium]|nr:SDR family oxidoreductase [Holophagaceae bacterium]